MLLVFREAMNQQFYLLLFKISFYWIRTGKFFTFQCQKLGLFISGRIQFYAVYWNRVFNFYCLIIKELNFYQFYKGFSFIFWQYFRSYELILMNVLDWYAWNFRSMPIKLITIKDLKFFIYINIPETDVYATTKLTLKNNLTFIES